MWSLFGLRQVLKLQKKMQEADLVYVTFKRASIHADINIEVSCQYISK